MRGWIAVAAVAGAVAAGLACPTAQKPCVNCPALQGSWDLVTQAPVGIPCLDGGTVRAGELVLNQVGANLDGTFVRIRVNGVVYESQQLTLSGDVSMTAPDAGVPAEVESVYLFGRSQGGNPPLMNGELTVSYQPPDQPACTVTAPFTATRR